MRDWAPLGGEGRPEIIFGYPGATRIMLMAFECGRTMLEIHRATLDQVRDLVRRQQDEALAAMRRSLEGDVAPGQGRPDMAYVEFARMGVEAFGRMAEAMSASGAAGTRIPESQRRTDSPRTAA